MYNMMCIQSIVFVVHREGPLDNVQHRLGGGGLHEHGRIEHEFVGSGRGRGSGLRRAVADVVGEGGSGRERRRHRQVRRRRRAAVEAGRRRSRRKSVDGDDDVFAVDFQRRQLVRDQARHCRFIFVLRRRHRLAALFPSAPLVPSTPPPLLRAEAAARRWTRAK
jgi:hypothetical protein